MCERLGIWVGRLIISPPIYYRGARAATDVHLSHVPTGLPVY